MEHKREWITCDRCGREIKEMPKKQLWKIRRLMSPAEYEIEYPKGVAYISNIEQITEEVMGVHIVEDISVKRKTFDLCPKCREDFKRFMEECTKECECVQCGNAIKDALNPDSFLCGSAKRKNSK